MKIKEYIQTFWIKERTFLGYLFWIAPAICYLFLNILKVPFDLSDYIFYILIHITGLCILAKYSWLSSFDTSTQTEDKE